MRKLGGLHSIYVGLRNDFGNQPIERAYIRPKVGLREISHDVLAMPMIRQDLIKRCGSLLSGQPIKYEERISSGNRICSVSGMYMRLFGIGYGSKLATFPEILHHICSPCSSISEDSIPSYSHCRQSQFAVVPEKPPWLGKALVLRSKLRLYWSSVAAAFVGLLLSELASRNPH